MSAKVTEKRREVLTLCVKYLQTELVLLRDSSELNKQLRDDLLQKLKRKGVTRQQARILSASSVAKLYLKG